MSKRLALLAFLLLPATAVMAQDTDDKNSAERVEKPSRDFVMLQFTYEGWANKPDSVNLGGISRGFNAYVCYDFPIKNSNFSFAAGVGIGTSNIYFDNQEVVFTDSAQTAVKFVDERKDYKKFKLTTAYLEAPFELRYFGNKYNRNRGFKAALGLRAGTLVGAHTKGRRNVDGSKVIDKVNTRRFMENWRVAATARIGWGNITLMGTYNLNTLFKDGQGPEITPYSIGICLTGL